MKPLSDFYSRLIPFVPGCPEPTVNQAIVDAAIAFCEDSLALREDLDVFPTVVGVGKYSLDAPMDQTVARVLHVSYDGWPVEIVPADRIGVLEPVTGNPSIAYTTREGAEYLINLYPAPDKVANVRVSVATRPTRTATQLDDELFDHWAEGVLSGAMSRIMAVPNQPFSDPQSASMYMARAIHASNKARVESSYGRVRGQIKVTQRPFA